MKRKGPTDFFQVFLLVLVSSVAHAEWRGGVGYGYGSGSANAGNLAFFSSEPGYSDSSALTTSPAGLDAFFGWEGELLGIRGVYSAPSLGAQSGTFKNAAGTTFGTSSNTMTTTMFGADAYLKKNIGKSTVIYFGGGGGFFSSNLQEAWTFNSTGTGLGFVNGTLNATSTNGGSRVFLGGNTKLAGGFGIAYEVMYTYIKQKNFIVQNGYNFFPGAPAFTPGNQVYGSNAAGNGFNTNAFAADLSNTALKVYLTMSF